MFAQIPSGEAMQCRAAVASFAHIAIQQETKAMTREQAIERAIELHKARCAALWKHWTEGAPEPVNAEYNYQHGWIDVDGWRIRSDEFAPGQTYDKD